MFLSISGNPSYQSRYLLYSARSRDALRVTDGAKKICKVEFTNSVSEAMRLNVDDRALGFRGSSTPSALHSSSSSAQSMGGSSAVTAHLGSCDMRPRVKLVTLKIQN